MGDGSKRRRNGWIRSLILNTRISKPKQSLIMIIIVICSLILIGSMYNNKNVPIRKNVYVYDLPSRFNTDILSLISDTDSYRKYEAERDLHERFLKIATRNPEEADFFFVPVYASAAAMASVKKYRQSVRDMTRSKILEALSYIRKKYPFWDRKGGKDHVWIFSYDQGVCMDVVSDRSQETLISQKLLRKLKDSILLTHINDVRNECFQASSSAIVVPPYVSASEITKRRHEAKRGGKWNERTYFATFRGQMSLENPRRPWESIRTLYGPSKEQRVVSPESSGYDACWHMMSSKYATCSTSCESELLRTRVYSRGTRQHMRNMFEKDKDFHISDRVVSVSEYWDELAMSTFCLCPPSLSSWTPRIFEAIVMGCIPVIITKDSTSTKLPFEHLVDWSSISVRVSDVDVPFLGRILRSVSISELESKRRAMERFWTMFIGENSFENVLNELSSLSLRRSSIDTTVVMEKDTRRQDEFRVYTGNADITITTQMSLDRASQLEILLNTWQGPVSVAIYLRSGQTLSNSEYGKQVQRLIAKYGETRLRCALVQQENETLTEFVAFVDADFSVPEQMYEKLRKHVRRFPSDRNTAFVIPAFQTDLQYLPSTKALMISAIRNRKVQAFQQKNYPSGHYATNTKRWLEADRPYEVRYRFGYEPFLVLKRPAPYYDERFVGYGQNKVSYAYELAARNYRFVVLPDVYIAHTYEETEASTQRKDWTVGWSCWRDFAKDMQRLHDGFHPVEPCWVSQYIWPKVIEKRGEVCIRE